MKELISVIVPCYNVEKYIKKCIDSILSQTYTNLEIILVNDGSTDSCGKICNSYARIDKRIKVIHKENGGLSDARNKGIEKATGEYITFIDSDDYVELNYIELLYKNLTKTHSDIAIGGHFIKYPNKKLVKKANFDMALEPEEALALLLYDNGIDTSTWGKLYKTNLFKRIRFPKGRLFEDTATTYKLLHAAEKISIISTPIYYYVIRKDSISNSVFSKRKLDLITSTEEMTSFIREKHPELEKAAKRRLMFSYLATLRQIATSKGTNNKAISNELMNYIKANRASVLSDKRTPKRDRFALYSTFLGFRSFKTCWKIYELLSRR